MDPRLVLQESPAGLGRCRSLWVRGLIFRGGALSSCGARLCHLICLSFRAGLMGLVGAPRAGADRASP
eukprot:2021824-Alexandrium_andersonii.AAC.1